MKIREYSDTQEFDDAITVLAPEHRGAAAPAQGNSSPGTWLALIQYSWSSRRPPPQKLLDKYT